MRKEKIYQSITYILSLILIGQITYLHAETIGSPTKIHRQASLEKTISAVVSIAVKPPIELQQNNLMAQTGSGFFIDEQGHILTNAHVIGQQTHMIIHTHDGQEHQARLIGKDIKTDIALLKTDDKVPNFIPLNLTASYIGETVFAVGNPMQLSHSLTSGIISAFNRGTGTAEVFDFIQTDTALNPGNSGGPLVNQNGELIGMNTAIIANVATRSNIGIGFAIPNYLLKNIAEQLMIYGQIKPSFIGVKAQELKPDLAKALSVAEEGVLITDVMMNSPGKKGQLKEKDIILAINDTPIRHILQLHALVYSLRAGEQIKISYLSEQIKKSIHVTSIDIHDLPQAAKQKNIAGITFVEQRQTLPNGELQTALRIIEIDGQTPAFTSGLQPGDILLSINDEAIATLQELNQQQLNNKTLLLKILRKQTPMYIAINE